MLRKSEWLYISFPMVVVLSGVDCLVHLSQAGLCKFDARLMHALASVAELLRFPPHSPMYTCTHAILLPSFRNFPRCVCE